MQETQIKTVKMHDWEGCADEADDDLKKVFYLFCSNLSENTDCWSEVVSIYIILPHLLAILSLSSTN